MSIWCVVWQLDLWTWGIISTSIIILKGVNGSFQKRSTLPPRRQFLPSGGEGKTKLFLIIVNVLGHPKGVGGLTSNFLRGGGGCFLEWPYISIPKSEGDGLQPSMLPEFFFNFDTLKQHFRGTYKVLLLYS